MTILDRVVKRNNQLQKLKVNESGLWINKVIVVLKNGEIEFKSKGENKNVSAN